MLDIESNRPMTSPTLSERVQKLADALDEMWDQFSYNGSNGGLSALEICEQVLSDAPALIAELKRMEEANKQFISRFEVIDKHGRQIVHYGTTTYQIQDDGRTLKVFLEDEVIFNNYREEFPYRNDRKLNPTKPVVKQPISREALVEAMCKAYDSEVDSLGDNADLKYCNDVPMWEVLRLIEAELGVKVE